MNRFLERLETGEILVADGATGTNLQKAGLKAGMPPEVWVMEAPERILALEESFVQAGSNLILTCTFGGTELRLKDTPYVDRVADVNQKAAAIARQAAEKGNNVLIGGSMGPVGGLIKPYGPLSIDDVRNAYRTQAGALDAGGVDFLVIETQFSLDEAKAALIGVREVSDLPVVVSFSFDRGVRTMMGVKPAQVVDTFRPLGVSAIGANCGTTLENMEAIIKEYAEVAPGMVLWAKPNAGMPKINEAGETVFDVQPESMGEFSLRYIDAGARIIGGCCGNTPDHIAAISKAVRQIG